MQVHVQVHLFGVCIENSSRRCSVGHNFNICYCRFVFMQKQITDFNSVLNLVIGKPVNDQIQHRERFVVKRFAP